MKFLLFLFLVIPGHFLSAQDINALLADAQKLEINLKEAEALQAYKEILRIDTAQPSALVRASELNARAGLRLLAQPAEALPLLDNAKSFAERALRVNEKDADALFVMGYACDGLAQISKAREKVQYLNDSKGYAEAAIAANPKHGKAHYLLGKWHYDASKLNAAERAAAKIRFGGLPKAYITEALKYFELARTLDPFIMHDYWLLANTYVEVHKSDKAIDVLNRMVKLPNRTADDPALRIKGRELLAKLQ